MKFDNDNRQLNSLSQAILLNTVRGRNGFKSMGYVFGSSDNAFGFDSDTGQIFWKNHLGGMTPAASTLACPGGAIANIASATPLTPAGGADRSASAETRGAVNGVGEPGQGEPASLTSLIRGGGRAGASGAAGRGGATGASGRGGGGGGRGRGGGLGVIAMGSDGMLHSLSEEQGFDVFMTPIRFLPANADASGLILIDNTAYVGTANDCGGVANGVWALGVSVQDKTVIVWKTNGGQRGGHGRTGVRHGWRRLRGDRGRRLWSRKLLRLRRGAGSEDAPPEGFLLASEVGVQCDAGGIRAWRQRSDRGNQQRREAVSAG
jgi:hypothetical protein